MEAQQPGNNQQHTPYYNQAHTSEPNYVINYPTNAKEGNQQANETQAVNNEPIRITIDKDNRKDRNAIIANIISFLGFCLAAGAFYYTYQLFTETQKAAAAAQNSAAAAQDTYAEQVRMDRLQEANDRVKDSIDSLKYMRDTIAENRRDSMNNAIQAKNLRNQERLFGLQRQSVQRQIEAFERDEQRFKVENRPFVQAGKFFLIDSVSDMNGTYLPKVTFEIANKGKNVVQITKAKFAFGNNLSSDTSDIIKNVEVALDNRKYIPYNTYLNNISAEPGTYTLPFYLDASVYTAIDFRLQTVVFGAEFELVDMIDDSIKRYRVIVIINQIGRMGYNIIKNVIID